MHNSLEANGYLVKAKRVKPGGGITVVLAYSVSIASIIHYRFLRVAPMHYTCSADGQPTQRATNYTARSNIDTAQIFIHANGQRPNRAMIRQRSRRRQRRGEPHTEHGLGVLLEVCTVVASIRAHFLLVPC